MERTIYVIENGKLKEVKNVWDFIKRIAAEMNAALVETEPEEEEEEIDFGQKPPVIEKKETDRFTANNVPFEPEDLDYAVSKRIITQWEMDFLLRVKFEFAQVSGKQKALAENKLAALYSFYKGNPYMEK